MAKLIQIQKTGALPGICPRSMDNAVAQINSPCAVALYEMEPGVSGNVDFVLFLSGNSTFRVDVVAFEE